ncbi:MAG: hypothetical protein KAS04_00070 [Candidatus Aenigmarchaeota archaeon]|nr:hypothetical protein [Candidatus Aenigmarchaeota archaeon]
MLSSTIQNWTLFDEYLTQKWTPENMPDLEEKGASKKAKHIHKKLTNEQVKELLLIIE